MRRAGRRDPRRRGCRQRRSGHGRGRSPSPCRGCRRAVRRSPRAHGATAEDADEARTAWAAVANACSAFEPVTVVVDPVEAAAARSLLAPEVEIVEAPLNDAWMRDIGPTFVHQPDGSLAGVDWVFN